MKGTIDRDRTLLIDGPASIEVVSGQANVLGAIVRKGDKIIVRDGKRMSFQTNKRTIFDVVLGNGASSEEIDGSTIPVSWNAAVPEIFSIQTTVTIMVLGGADSGKTSLCTFLANEALRRKRKPAIIDADLGQSDVGPPSTLGFSRINSYVKDLFEIEAESAHFIGVTSPTGAAPRVVEGLTALKDKASQADTDFLIINTDGWIAGEDAVEYKTSLVNQVRPDVVVGIQHEDELAPILTGLPQTKTVTVECPQQVHRRNREKRKVLRELSYTKYLKNAKVQSFPLRWIQVKGAVFGAGSAPVPERIAAISSLLGRDPIYCEETPDTFFVVLRKGQWVDEAQVKRAEEQMGKGLKVIGESDEEGLLVALQNELDEFLGIGVLGGVDYRRRTIKVYTPVREDVAIVRFGQIKLDKKGRETGISTVYADYAV